MRKAPKGGKLHPEDERINRIIGTVRARVEHPVRILERQFGYVKTRYRGLAKNRAQLFTLFALGNLCLVRRRLPDEDEPIRNLPNRRYGGRGTAKKTAKDPCHGPRSDQASIATQPNP